MADMTKTTWQGILWREWRYGEDKDFADRLFPLVADEAAGWPATVIMVVYGALLGGVLGAGIGLVGGNFGMPLRDWTAGGALPWGLGLAVAFALVALLLRVLAFPFLTWGVWLEQVSPGDVVELPRGAVWLGLGTGLLVFSFLAWAMNTVLPPVAGYTLGGGIEAGVLFAAAAAGGLFMQRETGQVGPGLGLAVGAGVAVAVLVGIGPGVVCTLAWALGLLAALLLETLGEPSPHVFAYRRWWHWWRPRPTPAQVEAALAAACAGSEEARKVFGKVLARLAEAKANPESPYNLMRDFRNTEWAARFIARHVLVALGGEAVEQLRGYAANRLMVNNATAVWMLHAIADDTRARFAVRRPPARCARCLTAFGPHTVKLVFPEQITFYGCRACRQSWEVLPTYREVVAVLDVHSPASRVVEGEVLRVNWLADRKAFDFDRVEIRAADDEQVERFAVQVGNDTDPQRKSRYRGMRCDVIATSGVSESGLRILRATFGAVNVREARP
jgi:hypothetical protein